MITETVSKKRGRPVLMEQSINVLLRSLYGDITTTRGLQNQYFVARCGIALGTLNTERHEWFLGGKKGGRQGIMVEIGRIAVGHGDLNASEMADGLSTAFRDGEIETTRDGVAWLRQCRMAAKGKATNPTADELSRRIWKVVRDFIGEHREIKASVIEDAVNGVLGMAQRLPGGSYDDGAG